MNVNFDINAYLRLNFVDMIMVCISTLLIVLIAKHFFWDKVVAYLNARTAAIQADIDAGKEERNAGERYKEEYATHMANAKEEAHAILESAKATAAQEKREILQEARVGAEALKTKAQLDIEREKANVKEEMKQAIVEVAFSAAQQIVEKELDEKTHKKYVDEFIDHAGDDSWQA